MTPHPAKVFRFAPRSTEEASSVRERTYEPGIALDYATRRAILCATIIGALFWTLLIAWLSA